jgi:hypothetical protein
MDSYMRAYLDRLKCEEAIKHGPADRDGRCPWCKRKITSAVPRSPESEPVSDLSESYGYYHDPDWTAEDH